MDNNDVSIYRLNYTRIAEQPEVPSSIRALATKLQINPMMNCSEFFKPLTDMELEELRELTLDPAKPSDYAVLLTLILTAAEGTSALTDEQFNTQVVLTSIFISTASLDRKGLVVANYNNFSYGEELMGQNIATPTKRGIELLQQQRQQQRDNDND